MPKERVTRTTVYTFDELSEEAKQQAVENLYDLNVLFDWWDSTYDDVKQIGCRINGFGTDRGSTCDLTCPNACRTARLILENHGSECDTFKLAEQYMKAHEKIIYEADRDEEDILYDDDALMDLDAEFERALGEEYISLLWQEYDYLTSREAIIETVKANEYEFTEEGKLI